MMDRGKRHKLPKMQCGFLDSICLPVYQACDDHDIHTYMLVLLSSPLASSDPLLVLRTSRAQAQN